ncbi:MAG: hypothetical protein U5N56_12835 [Candidatus Marinimicrobia bacterium]|nr:hypothetical protein [Candidatus Neomarinimicrobiota bacterium]
MKKVFILLMVVFAVFAFADVNVTYVVNTSTLTGMGVADSTHEIMICGSEVGPEGTDNWYNLFLTWNSPETGGPSPTATNVGGDYWELEIAYPDSMIGWRMAYKLLYKSTEEDNFNWENIANNRMYTLPDTDTTLQVAYVNNVLGPSLYTLGFH